jgi:serine/threonine protein kinase
VDHQVLFLAPSTGLTKCCSPYRAPELLFGTKSYDAKAVDLWSLGATLAEFMTPLTLFDPEEEDEEAVLDPAGSNKKPPFIVPDASQMTNPSLRWSRYTLFDSSRGEIGLAWCLFKIRGTPTANNWPVSPSLALGLSHELNTPPLDIRMSTSCFEADIQRRPAK